MKSMTGYGKGTSECVGKTLTVELKAVNNRFLEINARLPKYLMAGDEIVRKNISRVLKRGTVDFFFDYKDESGLKTLVVDYPLAEHYFDAANELANRLHIENDIAPVEIMKLSDVISITSNTDNELMCRMLDEATSKAVIELDSMREKEGESIKLDFYKLIDNIRRHLDFVRERAPKVVSEYREKLKKRIEEYLTEIETDEAKLLNEVAFFADKADINEEISRLDSHIVQFCSALEMTNEVGRKLDFLTQEMNREVNTMGSKSNDLEITEHVIEMKNELEKIKEQVRNVE